MKNEIINDKIQEMISLQSLDMAFVKEYLFKITEQIENKSSSEKLKVQMKNLKDENDMLKVELSLVQKELHRVFKKYKILLKEVENYKRDITNG